MKAGRTAMTIHHIGTANDMVAAFGDAITAVPVPRGPNGTGWATFGDGSNAVFCASKNPRRRGSGFRACPPAPNNVAVQQAVGADDGDDSGADNWTMHPKRFIDATVQSLPIAACCPPAADGGLHPHGVATDHAEGAAWARSRRTT